jgi:hypothetical protein
MFRKKREVSEAASCKAAEFIYVGEDLEETRGKRSDQTYTLRKTRRDEAV